MTCSFINLCHDFIYRPRKLAGSVQVPPLIYGSYGGHNIEQWNFKPKLFPGRIRDKSSGRCLSVKNCELETGGGSNDDLTCVAVTTGRAPDANSSLADMLVTLNTGAFANA